MKRKEIVDQIKKKQSFLCVGLDTDLEKVPEHLLDYSDPVFEFNKMVIDATAPYAVAYKPNLAFYEAYGLEGWESLQKTMDYLNEKHPEIFTIADAKRGDIGNTSARYAEAFFGRLNFDAVTVAPYMGEDSVKPFLQFEDKWVILLALTSNKGSLDFQTQSVTDSDGAMPLYEKVIRKSMEWGDPNNLMFVLGATRESYLTHIREIAPKNFFLVPGVGAQGGDLGTVARAAGNKEVGLLVNSSRGIIYAGKGTAFQKDVENAARTLQMEMSAFI
jgi:orotidine-5'-phosphate decarboxylase